MKKTNDIASLENSVFNLHMDSARMGISPVFTTTSDRADYLTCADLDRAREALRKAEENNTQIIKAKVRSKEELEVIDMVSMASSLGISMLYYGIPIYYGDDTVPSNTMRFIDINGKETDVPIKIKTTP